MTRGPARRWAALGLLLAALCGEGAVSRPAGAEEGPEAASFVDRVNKAIEQGVDWLLAKPDLFVADRQEVAHWGVIGADSVYGGGQQQTRGSPAGPTALAVYALLKCGVDPEHPVVVRGFNWLREPHVGTDKWDARTSNGMPWRLWEICDSYSLAAIVLALSAKYDPDKENVKSVEKARQGKLKIKDKDDRQWLEKMVQALVERRFVPGGSARRGWRYNQPGFRLGRYTWPEGPEPPNGNEDLSSTQLATLALFSARRFGVHADAEVWTDLVEFTLAQQQDSGPERRRHDPVLRDKAPLDHARGFSYIRSSSDKHEAAATGAMTACGVANLLMARVVLSQDRKLGRKFPESDLARRIDTAVHDGLAWLDLHWSSFANPGDERSYNVYYLYALERAMDLLDKELVGTHLWYREGAESLLGRQDHADVEIQEAKGKRKAKGVFWDTKTTHRPTDVLDTCFALLFLKRATHGMVPPVTGN